MSKDTTIRNPELYNARSGDQDTEVSIDLKKARTGGAAHDVFIAGRYLMKITKAAWETKKGDKPGRNCVYTAKVVGPEGCSETGKMMTQYRPAPAGPEDTAELGESMMADLLVSILSIEGRLQAALDAGGNAKVKPRSLIDRVFAAEIVDDEPYQGKPRSKIQRYLLKDEYEARPGPDTLAKLPTATGASTGTVKAATTELMGAATGGGNAATPAGATAAVDALVF
jgi:hypothetical protein